ncbi:hypothetical protein MRX96_010310 [Rhipicephalus microplus]
MQSQLNEIVEHSKKQDAQMLEIARLIGDLKRTLKDELAQLVGGVSSMSSLLENLRPDERQRDSSKEERFPKERCGFFQWSHPRLHTLEHGEEAYPAQVGAPVPRDPLPPLKTCVRESMRTRERLPVICRPVGPSFCPRAEQDTVQFTPPRKSV